MPRRSPRCRRRPMSMLLKAADHLLIGTEAHRFFDVLEELEFVLNVVGSEHGADGDLAPHPWRDR